ncbi:ADK1 [Bugula neritina]|uniref:5'-deoxynucleotidase HDDC2 n=1 Tax=Bugula neritina TaxID=10212 RepID=A0A7J7J1A0_BUGNE|nr:ADK1 [Bugula neritina]
MDLSLLHFLTMVGKLKHLKRTGWVKNEVNEPECVASHMYRMSIMGMLIPQDSTIDKNRVIKMALVHDMAEAIVGDITPSCGVSQVDKYNMEKAGLLEMTKNIPDKAIADEIHGLWQEYEDGTTEVARLVKDFDKFDMILQAYEYEQEQQKIGHRGLEEFFNSTKNIFKTDMVKSWDTALRQKRNLPPESE